MVIFHRLGNTKVEYTSRVIQFRTDRYYELTSHHTGDAHSPALVNLVLCFPWAYICILMGISDWKPGSPYKWIRNVWNL